MLAKNRGPSECGGDYRSITYEHSYTVVNPNCVCPPGSASSVAWKDDTDSYMFFINIILSVGVEEDRDSASGSPVCGHSVLMEYGRSKGCAKGRLCSTPHVPQRDGDRYVSPLCAPDPDTRLPFNCVLAKVGNVI